MDVRHRQSEKGPQSERSSRSAGDFHRQLEHSAAQEEVAERQLHLQDWHYPEAAQERGSRRWLRSLVSTPNVQYTVYELMPEPDYDFVVILELYIRVQCRKSYMEIELLKFFNIIEGEVKIIKCSKS